VNVKYIEDKLDREEGFKLFNQLYEAYGSRKLFLILSLALCLFFIIDISYQLKIMGNISFLGLLISLGAIWYLWIKYNLDKKEFLKKEEKVYLFDLNNDTLTVNENIYNIKQYFHFENYLLFLHTGGYLSVCKNRVDKKILKRYIEQLEKTRTWKDTIIWSTIGLIIYFGMSYYG